MPVVVCTNGLPSLIRQLRHIVQVLDDNEAISSAFVFIDDFLSIRTLVGIIIRNFQRDYHPHHDRDPHASKEAQAFPTKLSSGNASLSN